jgi:tripartite-type tricarboxylate transporter receptor subunit TctC
MNRIVKLAALAASFVAATASAQNYPTKPIRFIVPYQTGGLGDTFGRALGQHLQERLGQPVVIDNRPGASQAIALELAAKAPADGYTIVYGTQSGLVFLTASRKSLPYDPLKDFAPIGLLFSTPFILVVHPSVPVKNVQELVAYARANPGKLSFSSIGVGSGQHLAMELFRMRTGVDMLHVPYKGSAASMIDLVAGQVQGMFDGPVTTLPQIRSGKIRALAVTSLKRTAALPDLPTVAESGVPNFESTAWFGLATQAAVPRTIVERLNRETNEWLKMASTHERFAAQNLDLMPSTPDEMAERIRNELPVWTKVMRAAGIQPR